MATLVAAALIGGWALRSSTVPAGVPGPASLAPVARTTEGPLTADEPAAPKTAPVDFFDRAPTEPAGSADTQASGMVPHPITPVHQRIFRENALLGNLDGAMDVKDVAGMRALLRQYRDEYPEDAHVMADGYQLIADCLEHPGSATRAVAQRYYDEQRDSGLRRYIRRHCLEAPTP